MTERGSRLLQAKWFGHIRKIEGKPVFKFLLHLLFNIQGIRLYIRKKNYKEP